MNLQEELEKAFIAGAEYMREETYVEAADIDIEMPIEHEVIKAAEKYVLTKALA